MKRRGAAYAMLLALCGCAGKELAREPVPGPPMVAARVTFRSHLSALRNCESRGVAPSLAAARAAGANLALVFAPPGSVEPGAEDSRRPGDEATWIAFEAGPGSVAGVRLFKCPDAFIERVSEGMKRRDKARK